MGYIYGKVTDTTQNKPVCNAQITLEGGNVAIVVTDWLGNFTTMNYPVDLPTGQYQVSFGSTPEFGPYPSKVVGTVELPASGNAEVNIPVSSNLQQSFTVAGSLNTLGGPVPADAIIKFVGVDGETDTQPDSSGSFAVNLPPGQYTVSCVGEGYAPTSVSGLVLPEDAIAVGWVLDFYPLEPLMGTVVDENQSPVPGATVAVSGWWLSQPGHDPFGGTIETLGSSTGPNTVLTNVNGFYIIQGPQDIYSVLVSVGAPGFDGQSQTVLFVTPDNMPLPSVVADFVLSKPSATIWGTVTEGLDGGAGSPLPGALVAAGSISTWTDSNGQYTLSNVPAGPVTLTVGAKNPLTTLQHYVHYMQESEVLQVAHGGTYQQDFALITKPPRKPVGEMPTPVPKTPGTLKPGV